MNKVTTVVSAMAVAAVVASAAHAQQSGQTTSPGSVSQPQTQQPTPSDRTQAPAQGQRAAGGTSFIGCVERGSGPNQWVLVVTEMPSGSASASSGTSTPGQREGQVSGTAGAAGAGMVGQRVDLTGSNELSKHVGHKVEVTGMMTPRSSSPAAQANANANVNVKDVRMISTTCESPSRTGGATGTGGSTGTTAKPDPSTPSRPSTPEPQGKPDPRP